MEAQDKLTSKMKEAARNAESQAFPGMDRVWERVTERLDEKPESKVVPFFSYKRIAAAAAVLITLGLGSAYLFTEKNQAPVVAENNAAQAITTPVQAPVNTVKTIIAAETSKSPGLKPVKTEQAVESPALANSDGVPTLPIPEIIEPSVAAEPPTVTTHTEIIRGKVVDENGEGIPGATVKLLGAERGTQTDIEGNYELEVITSRPTLEIVALGYRDQNVFTDDNLNAGTVKLSPGGNALSDVAVTMPNSSTFKKEHYTDSEGIVQNGPVKEITKVVEASGYGSAQTTYGTGSSINVNKVVADNQNGYSNVYKGNQLTPGQSHTAKVNTDVLNYNLQQSNTLTSAYSAGFAPDITNFIEGAAPGVQVINGSGTPAAGTSVKIRGKSSQHTPAAPLIIVDGVPYNGDIASINPKDVAKMTVLKDSVATGIYGSKAINGAIIITTINGLHPVEKKKKK